MDGIGNINIMWGGTNEPLSHIIKKYIVKTAVFDSVDNMIEKIKT